MDKIIIAIPVPKKPIIDIRTAAFCAALHRYQQCKWVWSLSHYPEMGRNAIIEFQLRDPEVQWIFFVDSDTVPPNDALIKLIAMDKPIAAGVTPIIIKGQLHAWNVKKNDGTNDWYSRDEPLPEQPFITPAVGGSTVLIKREVFEKIGWPWYKTEFTQLQKDDTSIGTGEDVFFCERARECGYEIWIDPSIQCDHYNYINLLTLNENGQTYSYNKRKHAMDGYATHLPVLASVIARTTGPVLELGCGLYSTPVLDQMCNGRGLVSCEFSEKWLKEVAEYSGEGHQFKLVKDWDENEVFNQFWDVVLVDHEPANRRAIDIDRLREKANYIVVHDTEIPTYGYEPVLRKFKYRYDYKKLRPFTTVVSNKYPLGFLGN